MLKRIAILLLCFPLLGFGIIPISGRREPAAGGGIEDDFSGTLSKWTKLSGATATIVSGEFKTNGSGSWIYTDEQTSTVSQWVLFKYAGSNVGSPDHAGAYFRSTNNASEYAYCLRVDNARDLVWRYCLGHSCTTIQTDSSVDISDNHYVGLEVTGTGDGTELDVWDFGATPPANRASWGSSSGTMTSNPANAADTGKYVGLYDGAGDNDYMDNFSAGDI